MLPPVGGRRSDTKCAQPWCEPPLPSGDAAHATVDGHPLRAYVPKPRSLYLIACGPRGFVEQLQGWWTRSGTLQVESFSPLQPLAADDVRDVQLRFARSGQQVQGSSQLSLLEQAGFSGIDRLPYSIRILLENLLRQTELNAYQRLFGGLRCADVMSRNPVSVLFGPSGSISSICVP